MKILRTSDFRLLTSEFGIQISYFRLWISDFCFHIIFIPTIFSANIWAMDHEGVERGRLICSYFHQGLSYNKIVLISFRIHGISLCIRQLKRILGHIR